MTEEYYELVQVIVSQSYECRWNKLKMYRAKRVHGVGSDEYFNARTAWECESIMLNVYINKAHEEEKLCGRKKKSKK